MNSFLFPDECTTNGGEVNNTIENQNNKVY